MGVKTLTDIENCVMYLQMCKTKMFTGIYFYIFMHTSDEK